MRGRMRSEKHASHSSRMMISDRQKRHTKPVKPPNSCTRQGGRISWLHPLAMMVATRLCLTWDQVSKALARMVRLPVCACQQALLDLASWETAAPVPLPPPLQPPLALTAPETASASASPSPSPSPSSSSIPLYPPRQDGQEPCSGEEEEVVERSRDLVSLAGMVSSMRSSSAPSRAIGELLIVVDNIARWSGCGASLCGWSFG